MIALLRRLFTPEIDPRPVREFPDDLRVYYAHMRDGRPISIPPC